MGYLPISSPCLCTGGSMRKPAIQLHWQDWNVYHFIDTRLAGEHPDVLGPVECDTSLKCCRQVVCA